LISGCIQTPPGEEENKTITKNETLAALSHYNLAESYFDSGDFEKAIAEYEKVLEYPDSNLVNDAEFKIAYCHYKMRKLIQAIEEFKNITQRKSDLSEKALFYTAASYALLGNCTNTFDWLKKLTEDYPDSDLMRIYSHDIYLYCYIVTQQIDKALEEIKYLKLEEKLTNANSYNTLGYIYALLGVNLDRAKNYVKKALESEPKNPVFLDSLALVYYKQGKYYEAEKLFKEIMEMSNNSMLLCMDNYRLGLTYIKLNKTSEAIDKFKKVNEYAFNDECLQYIEKSKKELEKLNITE
jgi:tetratricopeptide (TPR) repeat protein